MTAFVGGVALAQGADAINGTWKLNVAKSTFSPGPAPRSTTIVLSGTDAARKIVFDATPQGSTAVHWEVSGGQGVQLPIVGTNPNADTYLFKRIDGATLEAQYLRGGKPTIKQTAVVSADGKTLTIKGTGVDAQGRNVNNVAVYDK